MRRIGGVGRPDSAVTLYLPFAGADGSVAMRDYSQYNKSIVVAGNAQIDTAYSKNSSSSLLLDGSGDYIRTEDATQWYAPGTTLTIDFFVRFASLQVDNTFILRYASAVGFTSSEMLWAGYYGLSHPYFPGQIVFAGWNASYTWSAGSLTTPAWTPTLGVWYHLAFTVNGNLDKVYIEGIGQSAQGVAFYLGESYATATYIGAGILSAPIPYINGNIAHLRFTNKVRWTGNFTPPTMPYVGGLR